MILAVNSLKRIAYLTVYVCFYLKRLYCIKRNVSVCHIGYYVTVTVYPEQYVFYDRSKTLNSRAYRKESCSRYFTVNNVLYLIYVRNVDGKRKIKSVLSIAKNVNQVAYKVCDRLITPIAKNGSNLIDNLSQIQGVRSFMREHAVAVVHINKRTVFDAFGQVSRKLFYVSNYGIINVAVTFKLFDIAINRVVEGSRISKNISYRFSVVFCPINSIKDSQELINRIFKLSDFKLRSYCAKSRNVVSKEIKRVVIGKATISKSLSVRGKRIDNAVDIALVKIYVKGRAKIIVKVCINRISVKESVEPSLIIYALSIFQKLLKRIRSSLINHFTTGHTEESENLILKLVANLASFGKLQKCVANYFGNVDGNVKVVSAERYVYNLSNSRCCLLDYLSVAKKSERKRKLDIAKGGLQCNICVKKILKLLRRHVSNFVRTRNNCQNSR